MQRDHLTSCLSLIAWAALAAPACGQSTGTPSYNAPTRAFEHSELGMMVSFPEPLGTAYEGVYRATNGRADVGIRGGVFEPGGGRANSILAGFEVRSLLVGHDAVFPLDAALVLGAGGSFLHGDSRFTVPVGVSLGRRLDESGVSIAPYFQPTVLLRGGHTVGTRFIIGMGVGTDVRLNHALDLRLSGSFGDLQGMSLGAAWVH